MQIQYYYSMPAMQKNASAKTNTSTRQPIHVLVVDDLRVNFLLVKAMLGKLNPVIDYCDSGAKAIEHIRSGRKTDVVLMDFNMPGMDGKEATEHIKVIRPNLPVISLSTFTDSPAFDKEEALYDGYLTKPIQADLLIDEIYKHLGIEP